MGQQGEHRLDDNEDGEGEDVSRLVQDTITRLTTSSLSLSPLPLAHLFFLITSLLMSRTIVLKTTVPPPKSVGLTWDEH